MRQLVPTFILERMDAAEHQGTLHVAAMFVDLSGFSTMADELGKHGHHGSEVLAVVMQSIFEPMVHSIYSQGGFVVGYAGDAITAIFTGSDGVSRDLRCLSAAAAIQKYFIDNPVHKTSFGTFPVGAKIGLSSGDSVWEIIYSANKSKATYCFRGEALDTSAQAEHRAKPGEIWLHSSLHQNVRADVSGAVVDVFFKLESFGNPLPELPVADDETPSSINLELFFSPEIINLKQRGEFRPIVNVFIDISTDIEHGNLLETFLKIVFDLQDRYGGFFLRPDFGDKGANLLIFWGAPVANENDIERALNFLLELREVSSIPFSAGVSYQLAYAGFIGASHREDYTSYGWGIALSARMMKSAQKGEIWVDGEVAQREDRYFNFGEPEAREFKGFTTKQNVYALLGRKESDEQVYRGIFEGRKGEIDQLLDFAAPLLESRFAGSMLVKGDAGVGKSRLVHEFRNTDFFLSNDIQWAFCQADEIVRQSLNPFRYWLRRRFGIDSSQNDEENREVFFMRIQRLADVTPYDDLKSELIRTRSFLGALLNIYWDQSLYNQLDAKERYENTFIALSVLLRCESLQGPLILHFDDAHWFDDDTYDFLPHLVRTLTADESRHYPIAILATARPEGEPVQPVDGYPVRKLILSGLDAAALDRLAVTILGGPASPELIEFLNGRAEGNPFFVEQVLQYLQENNLLRKRKGAFDIIDVSQVDLLSTDIQAILVARLDRLTREVKGVIQSAAVLGREFEIRLLSEMLQDVALPDLINQAEISNIWVPLNEIRYIFRHALMRDAAYSMQLRSRQRHLHALAVEAIEKIYEDTLEQHYGELAYHAERAYDVEKARLYLTLAGHAAGERYQNAQALDYYRSAFKYTPENDFEARYSLHLSREKILSHWDQPDEQKQALDQLQSLAEKIGDADKLIESKLRRASYLGFVGEYQMAGQLAREAMQMSEHVGRNDFIGEAHLQMCDALFHQGLFAEAIEKGNSGADLARQHGLAKNEAQLLNLIGMAMLETEPAQATGYFEKARQIFKAYNDINNLLMPINNLGLLAVMRADFSTAQRYFEEALTLTHEIGNRKGESVLLSNLGWIAGLQGDYRKARHFSERNLSVCREVGERYTEIYTLINLSSHAEALGEIDAAVKHAEKGLALSRQSGEVSGEAWALTYLGNAYFALNHYERAQECYLAAVKIRQELDQGVLETEPAAGSARTALIMGDKLLAQEKVERVLAFIRKDATLEGTDQPVRVYLNSYIVLKTLNDPRFEKILAQGYEILNTRAAGIADPAAQKVFLDDIPSHKAILAAWEEAHAD